MAPEMIVWVIVEIPFPLLSSELKVAQELANSFMIIIRERRAERFDGWIN
jgi:hypothetical protein